MENTPHSMYSSLICRIFAPAESHPYDMSKDNNTNIILPDVLSINASDSTGEAGIVADIGTISALRGRPLATMTSIISQDEASGPHVSNLPMQLVAEQIYSALQKARPLAVKDNHPLSR